MTEVAEDCVFCNIVHRKIPSKVLFEDENVLVIPDILPKAPVHLLVLAKMHIPSLNQTKPDEQLLLGKMLMTAVKAAKDAGVDEKGYRVSINVGADGGQVVPHLHVHVMGGKQMVE